MTGRRDFLGWIGAASLLGSVPSALEAESMAQPTPSRAPLTDKFDMTWYDHLHGKQVGVFDSPELSEGGALFRAVVWRKQHAEMYGTAPEAMMPVVVFRHGAIPLVMNDAYWKRFEIGKEVKLKDPATRKWSLKNPVGAAVPGTPADFADINLDAFINTGGVVLACNMAFSQCVTRIIAADKLSHDDAYEKARSMLWPGVILQPSGFFAVLKAQETGGGYILAS